jgi:hypothetical protein
MDSDLSGLGPTTYHSSTSSHPPRLTPRIVSAHTLDAERPKRSRTADKVHLSIFWQTTTALYYNDRSLISVSDPKNDHPKHNVNIKYALVAHLSMPNLCSAKKTKATSPHVDVVGGKRDRHNCSAWREPAGLQSIPLSPGTVYAITLLPGAIS